MTKAEIRKQIKEQLSGDILAALIPLEGIGSSAKELLHEGWENEGRHICLNEAERAARGKAPLHSVGDVDIEIKVNGVTLRVGRADSEKPSVIIPVGMSDKVTTMALDHKYNYSFLLSALANAYGGDITKIQQVVDILNRVQDEAMVENNGRTSIDKSLLPGVHNPEQIKELVDSLTRKVRSRTKGTIRTNVSVTVEGLPVPVAEKIVVASDIIDTPALESPNGNSIPVSVPPSAIIVGAETEGGEGAGDASSLSDLIAHREVVTDALSSVLSLGDQTIGNVRKGMTEIGMTDDQWRTRFDALLKTGWITTNGASGRSCRYTWVGGE
jgi:hypothetical protein